MESILNEYNLFTVYGSFADLCYTYSKFLNQYLYNFRIL